MSGTERRSIAWRDDGRHTWITYVNENSGETRTVLQDGENDRAWLDTSLTVDVLP
jgi:hypothetical protein